MILKTAAKVRLWEGIFPDISNLPYLILPDRRSGRVSTRSIWARLTTQKGIDSAFLFQVVPHMHFSKLKPFPGI